MSVGAYLGKYLFPASCLMFFAVDFIQALGPGFVLGFATCMFLFVAMPKAFADIAQKELGEVSGFQMISYSILLSSPALGVLLSPRNVSNLNDWFLFELPLIMLAVIMLPALEWLWLRRLERDFLLS